MRTWKLLKTFFTGIVADFTPEILDQRRKNWEELENKQGFLQTIDDYSIARRKSMYETATRGEYLIIAYVFAGGGDIAALIASNSHSATKVMLKISVTLIILAIIILALAIAAKGKVMKKPRKGGESEPDEFLANAIKLQRAAKANPTESTLKDLQLEDHRDRSFARLHRRKIVLVVERRGQFVAAIIAAAGLIMMGVGLWLY